MGERRSNKFNLNLPSFSDSSCYSYESQRENESDNLKKDEELLLNILPSYHMFQSTISKNLTPTREDVRIQPPSYELTPQSSVNSTASSVDYFSGVNFTSPEPQSRDENITDGITQWEDTLLANSHKLKKLASLNSEISKNVTIQIYFTKEIGKPGVKPTMLDPLQLELSQGDYIYGYILVKNTLDIDVPFDMFSASLEGVITMGNNKTSVIQQPTYLKKFLVMFDFNASWNDGCLDRLVTDNNNPHQPLNNRYDPVDNTHLELDFRKILKPNITYKKFFAFRIPERLLEHVCLEHGLIKHLQLPPTLGVSNGEIISSLKRKWNEDTLQVETLAKLNLDGRNNHKYVSYADDCSFSGLSIGYSINVRIIGKASDYQSLFDKVSYNILNSEVDEYVVTNEECCFLRIIPRTSDAFESNRALIDEESKLMYAHLNDQINEKIRMGREMSNQTYNDRVLSNDNLRTESSSDLAKMRQAYVSNVKKKPTSESNVYESYHPYKKKTLLGQSKTVGIITLSAPKKCYSINYTSPLRSSKSKKSPSTLSIPINLLCLFPEKKHYPLPEYKKISVELIALTVKSKRLPIPFMINEDMLFRNNNKMFDDFDHQVIKRFQDYAAELSKILKDVDPMKLGIEKQMLQDIKCVANLSTKYDAIKLPYKIQIEGSDVSNQSVTSIPWELESLSIKTTNGEIETQEKSQKSFNLLIDFTSILNPTLDSYCLIPEFQFCLAARMYYIRISLRQQNNEKVTLKVPILLKNYNSH